MSLQHFSNDDFEKKVIEADKPVMVDFWAQWCGPCRIVGPIIEELAGDYEGKAVIGKLDVDKEGDVAQEYRIMSIPTVLIFNKGEVVEKLIGARTKEDYKKLLDKYV